jgi:hypothetical protein
MGRWKHIQQTNITHIKQRAISVQQLLYNTSFIPFTFLLTPSLAHHSTFHSQSGSIQHTQRIYTNIHTHYSKPVHTIFTIHLSSLNTSSSSTSSCSLLVTHRQLHSSSSSTSLIHHGGHSHTSTHTELPPLNSPSQQALREYQCTRITMIGLWSNIGLAMFKFGAGVYGNSMALIADAVHSLSDLVTDFITLWAARLSHKQADMIHPYGSIQHTIQYM